MTKFCHHFPEKVVRFLKFSPAATLVQTPWTISFGVLCTRLGRVPVSKGLCFSARVSGAVNVGPKSVNSEFSVAGKANVGCGANLPIM